MDAMGAEKLLGNGDMLYKNSTMPDSERYQGAFITALEIKNIVDYVVEHNKAYFDAEFTEFLEKTERVQDDDDDTSVGDFEGKDMSDSNADLLIRALALAISMKSISISQIQRRFQVGYIRAAGLIDKMEDMGYISPSEGSKARRVLITKEEFEEKFGPMDL
jgi:S-DNA-T family DNA segregation ATPase FtsK/SpoIIIE